MSYAPPPPPPTRRSIYDVRRPSLDTRPTAAAVLIAVGSVFVMIEGLVYVAIGNYFSQATLGVAGTGIIEDGIVMAAIGVGLFAIALLVQAEPHHHAANGGLALVLVLLSFTFGIGGFFLGGLLAVIGGLWAIVWQPTVAVFGPPSRPVTR